MQYQPRNNVSPIYEGMGNRDLGSNTINVVSGISSQPVQQNQQNPQRSVLLLQNPTYYQQPRSMATTLSGPQPDSSLDKVYQKIKTQVQSMLQSNNLNSGSAFYHNPKNIQTVAGSVAQTVTQPQNQPAPVVANPPVKKQAPVVSNRLLKKKNQVGNRVFPGIDY